MTINFILTPLQPNNYNNISRCCSLQLCNLQTKTLILLTPVVTPASETEEKKYPLFNFAFYHSTVQYIEVPDIYL